MPTDASILAALRLVTDEIVKHALPLPRLGKKGASLPYMANEVVVATVSWIVDTFDTVGSNCASQC